MTPLPDLETVLSHLRSQHIPIPQGNLCVTAYGDSPELSDDLLSLIIAGRKVAGSTLTWALEADGEAPSKVGDIEIIVDVRGNPAVITRIIESYIVPFEDVSSEYAALEGEGDGSLKYWRDAHWKFFSRECARLGRRPSRSMPVSCAIFEVVHVVRTV